MNRVLLLSLWLGWASCAHAATYHVAPQPLSSLPANAQFRTIGEAAKVVHAGDNVIIHTGVYREGVSIEASGTKTQPISFEPAPGATVVVTGADVLTDWRREDAPAGENVFSTPWPYRFIGWSKTLAHPDDEQHRLIGRAEQVFANGYGLRQVLSRDKMTRGTFFADTLGQRLYVQVAQNPSDLKNTRIEASTRSTIWNVKGANVQTRGIRFRFAANAAQQGMTVFGGVGDCVLDCTFEKSNASGAAFLAPDIEVRRCTFQENGQLGWGAAGAHRLLFADNITRGNNTKDFSRGWEAGGCKIVLSRAPIFERCQFVANRGSGLWFDIGNENPEVRQCLFADNEDAGLFYEISLGLHAHDNILVGNGLADSPGAWGANGGLTLSSSPGCVIERNLFVGNKEGFQLREQGRTTPRIDAPQGAREEWIWNHDQTIRSNTFALNRDAGVWGWFDVRDERHFPAPLQKFGGKERPQWQNDADFARAYQADLDNGAPRDLTFEKLNLRFDGNVYAPGDSGALFHWGVAWMHHEFYDGPDALPQLRAQLGFERNGVVAPFDFANYLARDFRVPASSIALKERAYPQGEIPGAQTGVLPPMLLVSAGANR